MNRVAKLAAMVTVLGACALSNGCATSAGSLKVMEPVAPDTLARFQHLNVVVEAAAGVPLSPDGQSTILGLILTNVRTELPGRFQTLNAESPVTETLAVKVTITRYDDGNAFARFMLAGLGAMHIDGDVVLSESEENGRVLGRCAVAKTFAWGGVYGASTTISDIQDGFAKAVVSAIGGKKE